MIQHTRDILSRLDALYKDGDDLLDSILAGAEAGDTDMQFLLREAADEVQELLLRAKKRGIPYPELVNLFTGTPLIWSWHRHAPLGALEQLLFFAALVHAVIVHATNPAPSSAQKMGFALSRATLTGLMQWIATDSGTVIEKPFPYSQDEMRRSFEEHSPNIEKAWE